MLESMTKFTGERYEMGMLWSEPKPNLPNSYSSAWCQLYSLEHRIQREPKFVSTVNRYRCKKRIRKDIERVRSEKHVRERMVFASPSSAKPEQAWQSKTCLNAASKYKKVCLNYKLLAGPDLLHGLIGTIFKFCE